MRTPAEAWELIEQRAAPLDTEELALEGAIGRVLRADLRSRIDLPPFDNSAMDGYAVRATDTALATEDSPVHLPVIETIAAGVSPLISVDSGTAHRIMTGAPMPRGADSVLQLEHGLLRDEVVGISNPVPVGRHVRHRATDLPAGAILASAGTRLEINLAGLLANAGVCDVTVTRRVRTAVLATGRELVPAVDASLEPGQIFDSNGIVMRAYMRRAGCEVTDLGIARDEPDDIEQRVRKGLDCDVLLISGGVSVGKYDHVKDVLKNLGMERIFWRVRMKPGKPLLCGRLGNTWIFGLPGNPISCVAGIAAFINPLLRILEGTPGVGQGFRRARLTRPISNEGQRTLLATAQLDSDGQGQLIATPTSVQGSAMMHTLAQSNGFVVVPESTVAMEPGTLVDTVGFE